VWCEREKAGESAKGRKGTNSRMIPVKMKMVNERGCQIMIPNESKSCKIQRGMRKDFR
jgi:hypothetical protein